MFFFNENVRYDNVLDLEGVGGINNINKHLFGCIYAGVNMLITARPVRIQHFYIPLIFMALFSLFTLIYWLCGGTTLTGRTYIYPITDYSRPALVAVSFLGIAVATLFFQVAFWMLYRIRMILYSTFMYR